MADNQITTFSQMQMMAEKVAEKLAAIEPGTPIVTATSTDGVTYTATVDGLDSLVVGKEIIIVPNYASTVNNPKLNVNSLGAKYLRCPLNSNNTTTTVAASTSWIYSGKPIKVVYDGNFWRTDLYRIDPSTLYGTLPADKVGAGTFTGQVVAQSGAQDPSTFLLRNIKLMSSEDYDAVSDWTSVLSEGEIVLRCEAVS